MCMAGCTYVCIIQLTKAHWFAIDPTPRPLFDGSTNAACVGGVQATRVT